jgi:hypothetical protein
VNVLQGKKAKAKKKAVVLDSDEEGDDMSMSDNDDDSDFEAAPKKAWSPCCCSERSVSHTLSTSRTL